MAVRRVRRSAATLDQLIIRVRRGVGDILDDATPSAGNRKWEDSAIVDAINDMIAEMYVEMHATPDQIIVEQAVTYTAGADEVQLPEAIRANTIYAVYDASGARPRLLRRVDYMNAERSALDAVEPNSGNTTELTWSMRDDRIMLRPTPGADTALTVAILGDPFGMDAATTTDQHPMPVAHEELLCLGAMNRLQYPNDQLPIGRQRHYDRLWMKWQQECDRYQGPRYPVINRRYRSG